MHFTTYLKKKRELLRNVLINMINDEQDVIIIPSSSFLTFISGSDSGSFTFDNNQLVYNAQGPLIISSSFHLPNLILTSSAINYLVLLEAILKEPLPIKNK